MTWLLDISYLLMLHAIGFFLLRLLLVNKRGVIERWIPWSFLTGCVAATALQLVSLLLFRKIHPLAPMGLLPIFGATYFFARIRKPITWQSNWIKELERAGDSRNFYIILSLLILFCVGLFASQVITPAMLNYDAWAIWTFKGHILWDTGTVFDDSFTDPFRVQYHRNYPLLIPFLESAFFQFNGGFDEHRIQLIFFWFLVNLLLVFYGLLSSETDGVWPLVFTLILACSPFLLCTKLNQVAQAGVDMPFSFFALCAVCMFHADIRKRDNLVLLIIAMIGALWTKNEGIILAAVITASGFTCWVIRPERKMTLKSALPNVLIAAASVSVGYLLWMLIKKDLPGFYDETFAERIAFGNIPAMIHRIPMIMPVFNEVTSDEEIWKSIWMIIFVVGVIHIDRTRRGNFWALPLVIFFWVAANVTIYTITPLNLYHHLYNSLPRLMWQVFPVAMLFTGFAMARGFAEEPGETDDDQSGSDL